MGTYRLLEGFDLGPSPSGADFFGIYAQPVLDGRRPMAPDTEPDAIPYTAEGQRAFDAYYPELNPRNFDDCATDPMPIAARGKSLAAPLFSVSGSA